MTYSKSHVFAKVSRRDERGKATTDPHVVYTQAKRWGDAIRGAAANVRSFFESQEYEEYTGFGSAVSEAATTATATTSFSEWLMLLKLTLAD